MKRPPSKMLAPFLRRITLPAEKIDPDRHPFNIAAFRNGLDLELRLRVTFFVGENGSGKSTLLESVAQCCGFSIHGGGRDHHDQNQDISDELAKALKLSWLPKATDGFFMRAESFFNFATYIDKVSVAATPALLPEGDPRSRRQWPSPVADREPFADVARLSGCHAPQPRWWLHPRGQIQGDRALHRLT
jgi:predicted ATPase